MKIENVEVYGFRSALRAMRNPMNSWDKSDSNFYQASETWQDDTWDQLATILCIERPEVGPNDLKLATKLIKGGSEHRKFLRQIFIWMDITIPRYVWQELDTYKVATVRNSCSTMHKLDSRDLEQDDFEGGIDDVTLNTLNLIGKEIRQMKALKGDECAKKQIPIHLRRLKQLLPEGFLQKATYTFNYETALSMYFQRRNHRLPEWNERNEGSICSFLRSLPYMEEFIDAASKKHESNS